jgi:hypothetical protein
VVIHVGGGLLHQLGSWLHDILGPSWIARLRTKQRKRIAVGVD